MRPKFLAAARNAFENAKKDMGQGETRQITRYEKHSFGLQPDISIDYAVMEQALNVTLVPAKFGWSDVGSWPAVATARLADANGNTFSAAEHIDWVAVDTTNTHVHIDSHGPKRMVATVGIHNAIVVHTPDTALVSDKSHNQDVKKVVAALS